ncbi:hypothetical protein D3C80_2147980 [compost metagenome]
MIHAIDIADMVIDNVKAGPRLIRHRHALLTQMATHFHPIDGFLGACLQLIDHHMNFLS